MEPEDSFLFSQKLTSGPFPEPKESSQHFHILFLKNPF
jgi:hypothetical protein